VKVEVEAQKEEIAMQKGKGKKYNRAKGDRDEGASKATARGKGG
jgi:hypothetical protein